MKKIVIFTGARSEYSILKQLIRSLKKKLKNRVILYVSGMHTLDKFGKTINEIKNDRFKINRKIEIYKNNKNRSIFEFTSAIEKIFSLLKRDKPKAIYILGDRLEAYAAALAAHFASVDIFHAGGGNITKGSLDNIYRYNITNLSKYHFSTSKKNYKRLISLPTIEKKNVFLTGSSAIDSIKSYKKRLKLKKNINNSEFILMAFHSVTNFNENIDDIMLFSINLLLKKKQKILVTYPNNDIGYKKIIKILNKYKKSKNIKIVKNLGSKKYYTALNNCKFLIGNSSSGIIEAAYFNKYVLNIGRRQEGREHDKNVINVNTENKSQIKNKINYLLKNYKNVKKNHYIYGKGYASKKISEIIFKLLKKDYE